MTRKASDRGGILLRIWLWTSDDEWVKRLLFYIYFYSRYTGVDIKLASPGCIVIGVGSMVKALVTIVCAETCMWRSSLANQLPLTPKQCRYFFSSPMHIDMVMAVKLHAEWHWRVLNIVKGNNFRLDASIPSLLQTLLRDGESRQIPLGDPSYSYSQRCCILCLYYR